MSGREVALACGAIALILLVALLGGGMMMGPGMMGWGGYGTGMLWPIVMLVFWVLVVAGFVLLVVWLVRAVAPAGPGLGRPGSRALDILQERYARGEISREQFDQMRRDIEAIRQG